MESLASVSAVGTEIFADESGMAEQFAEASVDIRYMVERIHDPQDRVVALSAAAVEDLAAG